MRYCYRRSSVAGIRISSVPLYEIGYLIMKTIVGNEPMGRYLNAYMVAFIVVLEGFFSGLLVTFVILNWVTTDDVSYQLNEG